MYGYSVGEVLVGGVSGPGAGGGGGGGGGVGVGFVGGLMILSLAEAPDSFALAPLVKVAEVLVCLVAGCGISCFVQDANKIKRPAVMIMFFINQVLKTEVICVCFLIPKVSLSQGCHHPPMKGENAGKQGDFLG